MFLKNAWYVAAWEHELEGPGPIGRRVIGQPIVIYRKQDGDLVVLADLCPHRHAPLSLGRVEGDDLRCMYHGLKLDAAGQCIEVPGMDRLPPNIGVRKYPVAERDSWIWVWMGEPASADESLIPRGWGLNNPDWALTSGQLDYEANYQLINDNLTDLSHLDFVHETTLGRASGGRWSDTRPEVKPMERGLRVSRWFPNRASPGLGGQVQDVYNAYTYTAPGVFIMRSDAFPVGTATALDMGEPDLSRSLSTRVEQQAVTPIDDQRTRYLFASGMSGPAARAMPEVREMMFAVVQAAFAEDKVMIEAQQRAQLANPDARMAAIPQDRGPFLMRQVIKRLIEAETPIPADPIPA